MKASFLSKAEDPGFFYIVYREHILYFIHSRREDPRNVRLQSVCIISLSLYYMDSRYVKKMRTHQHIFLVPKNLPHIADMAPAPGFRPDSQTSVPISAYCLQENHPQLRVRNQ